MQGRMRGGQHGAGTGVGEGRGFEINKLIYELVMYTEERCSP